MMHQSIEKEGTGNIDTILNANYFANLFRNEFIAILFINNKDIQTNCPGSFFFGLECISFYVVIIIASVIYI